MSDEPNINEIIANIAVAEIDELKKSVPSFIAAIYEKVKLSWGKGFTDYLKECIQRNAKARSFFYRDEPTYIYDFYVPMGVKCGNKVINNCNALNLFETRNKLVIMGSGGSGKTVFLKHILIDIIKRKLSVPIIIELRDLNEGHIGLMDLLLKKLKDYGMTITRDALLLQINSGSVCLLLDGFDELNSELRQKTASEIKNVTANNSSKIIISSRPDNVFDGWNDFGICLAHPLSIDQVKSLVKKTPLDEKLKIKFNKDVDSGLYVTHQSFMSNPLLLSILLMCYSDSADIPNKMSVFYGQAYEALFQKHDARKGAYKRGRKSSLDILDFSKVFSAFSMLSYDKRKFTFSDTEALAIFSRGCDLVRVEERVTNVLEDSIKAVCLLVQDGLSISYSHRSFQEFFCAKFIADASSEVKGQLLKRFAKNMKLDYVVKLVHEMQPEFVEFELIYPAVDGYLQEIGYRNKSISRAVFLKHIQRRFVRFSYYEERGLCGHLSDSEEDSVKNKFHYSMDQILRAIIDPSKIIPTGDGKDNLKSFFIKGKNGSYNEVKAVDLNIKHPFLIELYKHGRYFGPGYINWMAEVKKDIENRLKQQSAGIEDILKIS